MVVHRLSEDETHYIMGDKNTRNEKTRKTVENMVEHGSFKDAEE